MDNYLCAGEQSYNRKLSKKKIYLLVIRRFIGKLLFNLSIIIYMGNQNKEFYKYYGIQGISIQFLHPTQVNNNRLIWNMKHLLV